MLTLKEIVDQIPGARLQGDAGLRMLGVSTDSRSIAPGELFVALDGERFDGHDYLPQVAQRGAVAALVSRLPEADVGLPLIVVDDTRRALGLLALGWRRRFELPVVAVTGSNGKTTTKEMIAAILSAAYGADDMLATQGNLNNDIGVPLTLLRLRSHHRAAVIELGMNHPGETAALADMTAPTVVLITNAQREHQEFMENVEAVAREHGLAILALPTKGTAVFASGEPYSSIWWNAAGDRRVLEFAVRASHAQFSPFLAAVSVTPGKPGEDRFETPLHLHTPLGDVHLTLRAAGQHNAHNAAAAAAAAVAAGIALEAIRQGLEQFTPVRGRMQKKACAAGALLIDDSYNANPDSVLAAIDVLATMAAPRCLILGDMGEVGAAGPAFHAEVGHHAAQRQIECLLCLGPLTQHACAAFGPGARHFTALDDLIAAALALSAAGTLLVKGSRFMRMERVVDALQAGVPQTSSVQGSS